ncbi:MAG: hypothetical protein ACKO0Z_12505 [Betaproteobacteria bacterium]
MKQKRKSLLSPESIAHARRMMIEFENAKPREQRILSATYQRRFAGLKSLLQKEKNNETRRKNSCQLSDGKVFAV